MKMFMALVLLSVPARGVAQEAATLLDGDLKTSWFVAPVVKVTEIHEQFGVIAGLRGGLIINDSFVFGAGLYGLANEDHIRGLSPDQRRLAMGYGGLELEYIVRPLEVAHVSLSVLVGGGAAEWQGFGPNDLDPFFVAEPGLNVLVNVVRFMRVGFGGSYRFTGDVELPGLDDRELGGPAGVITVKLGAL